MKSTLIILILGVSLIEYSVFSFCCYAKIYKLKKKDGKKSENERCITFDDSVFFHLLLYRFIEENQR